ncbi:hypothetical protein D9758_016626 [Tetrapyrgos nigripes]|uniref:Uncharacterized protein n=1 Tax=Tetrapyrgos nigripes TaxID=182062 RepID=A0A8H5CAZ8_9AGAR|nr:hypothetical protein D9758_016626 [Tetrapyrgos nigripes]
MSDLNPTSTLTVLHSHPSVLGHRLDIYAYDNVHLYTIPDQAPHMQLYQTLSKAKVDQEVLDAEGTRIRRLQSSRGVSGRGGEYRESLESFGKQYGVSGAGRKKGNRNAIMKRRETEREEPMDIS